MGLNERLYKKIEKEIEITDEVIGKLTANGDAAVAEALRKKRELRRIRWVLKKRIPKAVIWENESIYRCPACDCRYAAPVKKFCEECGQKLKETEEEGL